MSVLLILFIIAFALLAVYFLYNLFFGGGNSALKVVWVVLLILLGVGFYLIYTFYFQTSSSSASLVYLNSTKPTVIAASTLSSLNSANSAFGIWVYVNTWNTDSPKTVFSTSGNEIGLYFHATQPSLYCGIQTGCGTNNKHVEKVLVTDSFPLQKWTYVIISLNGLFIDCYIDGKLVTSHRLQDAITSVSCTGNEWNIQMGQNFDAYAYNLIRYTNAMTPQQAYQTFYSTAPSSSMTGAMSGMSVNLAIVTNNDTCNATSIF